MKSSSQKSKSDQLSDILTSIFIVGPINKNIIERLKESLENSEIKRELEKSHNHTDKNLRPFAQLLLRYSPDELPFKYILPPHNLYKATYLQSILLYNDVRANIILKNIKNSDNLPKEITSLIKSLESANKYMTDHLYLTPKLSLEVLEDLNLFYQNLDTGKYNDYIINSAELQANIPLRIITQNLNSNKEKIQEKDIRYNSAKSNLRILDDALASLPAEEYEFLIDTLFSGIDSQEDILHIRDIFDDINVTAELEQLLSYTIVKDSSIEILVDAKFKDNKSVFEKQEQYYALSNIVFTLGVLNALNYFGGKNSTVALTDFIRENPNMKESKNRYYRDSEILKNKGEIVSKSSQPCIQCGVKRVIASEKQVHSADEPTTTFYHCQQCGYRWSVR